MEGDSVFANVTFFDLTEFGPDKSVVDTIFVLMGGLDWGDWGDGGGTVIMAVREGDGSF